MPDCIYCGSPAGAYDEHASCVDQAIHADELRKAEDRYQRAFRRYERVREERNATVLAAVEAGLTHAQIAEVTGLTRTRVGQIALKG